MKTSTKVVWMGYASIAFAFIWGSGIVAAIIARRMAGTCVPTTPREVGDLRGGELLSTIGLWLNAVVLAVIFWSMISTHIL
jgi:hypothetical protein